MGSGRKRGLGKRTGEGFIGAKKSEKKILHR